VGHPEAPSRRPRAEVMRVEASAVVTALPQLDVVRLAVVAVLVAVPLPLPPVRCYRRIAVWRRR